MRLNKHYVDHMVCIFQDEERAAQIFLVLKVKHAEASFQLRGFISNSLYVQNQLNKYGMIWYEISIRILNVNMNTADTVENLKYLVWNCKY